MTPGVRWRVWAQTSKLFCAFVSEDAKRENAFLMHVINVVCVACLSGLLLLLAVWTPGREKALGCYLFWKLSNNVISVELCMMILLAELFPFIPLSLHLTIYYCMAIPVSNSYHQKCYATSPFLFIFLFLFFYFFTYNLFSKNLMDRFLLSYNLCSK